MRALIFALGIHTGGPAHPADHWFGVDKAKHFFISALVESITYSALRSANVRHDPALIAASTFTLGVGVGKELYDHHSYGLFSVKDLTWDVAGNAAAATVLAHTR
jgi:putative lipoprotein